jgi:hypothetical protein
MNPANFSIIAKLIAAVMLFTALRHASLRHAGRALIRQTQTDTPQNHLRQASAKAIDNDLLTFANRMAGDSKTMNENTREV